MSRQRPGYQRSTAGLVGAMIITVGAVLAFVLWRSLFRGDGEPVTPPIEWTESVELADSAGMRIVRPTELPEGWKATSVDLRASGDRRWGLGMLTDEGDFVGLRQERSSVSELVHTYVDKDAVAGNDAEVESGVTSTWQTWSDDGGDLGYSTEVDDDSVLVYGSAPAEDLEEFIALLDLPDLPGES